MICRNERMNGGGQKGTSFVGEKGGGGVRAIQYPNIYNIFYVLVPYITGT